MDVMLVGQNVDRHGNGFATRMITRRKTVRWKEKKALWGLILGMVGHV